MKTNPAFDKFYQRQQALTREGYLLAAIDLLKPLFAKASIKIPTVRISMGWPSNRGNSGASETLGECWNKFAADDKVAQIFITPRMNGLIDFDKDDGQGILPCVVHELVHAAAGHDAHHGPHFKALAIAVGLGGPMRSTHAEPALVKFLQDHVVKKLGKFPHAKLNPRVRLTKKQTTRMLKCCCETCGYTIRVSQKWLDVKVPICPVDKTEMLHDDP